MEKEFKVWTAGLLVASALFCAGRVHAGGQIAKCSDGSYSNQCVLKATQSAAPAVIAIDRAGSEGSRTVVVGQGGARRFVGGGVKRGPTSFRGPARVEPKTAEIARIRLRSVKARRARSRQG